jgi:hypothetical protein
MNMDVYHTQDETQKLQDLKIALNYVKVQVRELAA